MEFGGFPFIGQGGASYFEIADLYVRLASEPDEELRAAIEELVPLPLRDTMAWDGPILYCASSLSVQVDIQEAYPEPRRRRPRRQATEAQVTAFNRDIETWLKAVHAMAPIALAYRRHDWEAGGTKLGAWHRASAASVPGLLHLFEDCLKGGAGSFGSGLLDGVLRMYLEEDDAESSKIPRAFHRFLDPGGEAVAALANGDDEGLVAVLEAGPVRGEVWDKLGHAFEEDNAVHRRVLAAGASAIAAESDVPVPMLVATAVAVAWAGDTDLLFSLPYKVPTWEAGNLGQQLFLRAYDLQNDDPGVAARLYDAAGLLEFADRSKVLGNAGGSYGRVGNHEARLRVSQHGVELFPRDPHCWANLLGALISLERTAEVPETILETGHEIVGGVADLMVNLTYVQLQRGMVDSAVKVVEAYLASGAPVPASAFLNFGSAYLEVDKLDQAEPWLHRARDNGEEGVWAPLTRLYARRGDMAQTLASAKEAARADGVDVLRRDPIVVSQLKDHPEGAALLQ